LLTRFFVQWLKLVNSNCKILIVDLLTCFLLTILKLVNVTAKCTILFTNGDKLILHFGFLLIWCITSLVKALLGWLSWRSPLALSIVRMSLGKFGHDWSGVSASVEVNISHVTI
jgi:hypothetical protein